MQIKKIISEKIKETKTIFNEIIDKSLWKGRAVCKGAGKLLENFCKKITVHFQLILPHNEAEEVSSFEKNVPLER